MDKKEIARRSVHGAFAVAMGVAAFKSFGLGVEGKIEATRLSLSQTDISTVLGGEDQSDNKAVEDMSSDAADRLVAGFSLSVLAGAELALTTIARRKEAPVDADAPTQGKPAISSRTAATIR